MPGDILVGEKNGQYYLNGVRITKANLCKYLHIPYRDAFSNKLEKDTLDYYIKRKKFIVRVNSKLGYNVEDVIPITRLITWLDHVVFFEDFYHLCTNFNKLGKTDKYWFLGRGFNSWKCFISSINIGKDECIEDLSKEKSYVEIVTKYGYRYNKYAKINIVCSLGSFDSLSDFIKTLGISYQIFNSIKSMYDGEDDLYEKIIQTSKVKNKFNLKTPIKLEDLVYYNGEYYPSEGYVIKMLGLTPRTVKEKMNLGVSFEEAINESLKISENNKIMQVKLYNFLKSHEDEQSRVSLVDGKVYVTVDGVTNNISGLCKRFGVFTSTFKNRLENGQTISNALDYNKNNYIYFLGKRYSSARKLCKEYNINRNTWNYLLGKYSIQDIEKLFKWVFDLVKKSGVDCYGRLNTLLHTARVFSYNDDELLYQIKNIDKIKDEDLFYLGGKSYRGFKYFYSDYYITTSKSKSGSVINILMCENNTHFYELSEFLLDKKISYESPKIYYYFYFLEYFSKIKKLTSECIEILIACFRDEIHKEFGNVIIMKDDVEANMLIAKKVFNSGKLSVLNMMAYSEKINVEEVSYRISNVCYYRCRFEDRVEYLSGDDLLNLLIGMEGYYEL